FLITNIADMARHLAAVFENFGFNLGQLFRFATNDGDMCTQCGQFMRGATTNAAAAAGDDNGSACKQVRSENGLIAAHDVFSMRSLGIGIGNSKSCCAKALPCGSMRRLATPPPPRLL